MALPLNRWVEIE